MALCLRGLSRGETRGVSAIHEWNLGPAGGRLDTDVSDGVRRGVCECGTLRLAAVLISAVTGGVWAGGAHAQSAPTPDLTPSPNLVLAQTVPPTVEPRDPRRDLLAPERQTPFPELDVPAYRGVVPPGAERVRFTLADVQITGNTVFSRGDFDPVFAPIIGQEIALDQLYAAANNLQAFYRAQGYLLTRVVVPAQRMTGGVARLQVVEGYISNIRVQGDIGGARTLVESYLKRVTRFRPVRTRDLERYLLLANDIPGVRASGVLRADPTATGAAELIVEVRRKAFDSFFTINNRGSQFTGPWATAIGGGVNSFTRMGERVEGLFYITLDNQDETILGEKGDGPEQDFQLISYEGRVGSEGTRFNIELSQGVSRPGFSLADLQIRNRIWRYTGRVAHPLIRTRRLNLDLSGELEHTLERIRVADQLVGRDRLTILSLGARLDFADTALKDARTEVSLQFRQGLPLGASKADDEEPLSRPQGTAVFTALRGRVERTETLTRRIEAHASLAGQYAFDTLLSQAEFRVGGDEYGRAFDPSELAGDRGFGGEVELRYNGTLPLKDIPGYQGYVFYDYGFVSNDDEGFRAQESLASTGAGVRTVIKEDFYLDAEYARTLNRALGSRADGKATNQVYVRFTAQF